MNNYHLKDLVIMKKPHACGNNDWIITRVGVDIKIKCLNCNREVMIDRLEFEQKVKKIGDKNEKKRAGAITNAAFVFAMETRKISCRNYRAVVYFNQIIKQFGQAAKAWLLVQGECCGRCRKACINSGCFHFF